MNATLVKKAFNKAEKTYDHNAFIQKQIAADLLLLIKSYQNQFNCIIDLGCGTGCTTEIIAQSFYYKKFYAIDIADQLLKHAHQRLAPYNIVIEEKNFDQLKYHDCSFDLIFSNMALHWSNDINKTFEDLYHQLNKNGLLVFSIPLTNTFHELQKQNKHSFYSFQEIILFLKQSGLTVLHSHINNKILSFDSVLSALRSIKLVGANYHHQHPGLHGRKYLKKLLFANTHPFFLTYEIGYFLARKTHA